MPCKVCKTKPIITLTNTNVKLCKSCFIKYFERKFMRTIRQYSMLSKKMGVAVSGGKNSMIVLYLLNKILKPRKGYKLYALHIDEGIPNYSKESNKVIEEFCKEKDIELEIFKIKKEFPKLKIKKPKHPFSVYGTLIRYLLNKKAREMKLGKIATGHNLDSEAETLLMNIFKHDVARTARLGPVTGIVPDKKFVPRVKPLYFLMEYETKIYAKIHKFKDRNPPFVKDSFRISVKNFLDKFEKKYPGTKHAIINSFLEILPLLKQAYKQKAKPCPKCHEPCSSQPCTVCKLIEQFS